MNHLAHFVLSGDNADLAIGNFVADFIKNRQLPNFTEGVQRGIWLHREIDAFTDAHPVVKQSTKRLHPFHHKYAPVIVDIYYDFLLAKNWDKFAPELPSDFEENNNLNLAISLNQNPSNRIPPSIPLPLYVQSIYNLLSLRSMEFPERLQTFLPNMIAKDFLREPTTFIGLGKSFERIEKVATFPGNFGNAAQNLETYLEAFDEEFCLFFPDLQNHVLGLMVNC